MRTVRLFALFLFATTALAQKIPDWFPKPPPLLPPAGNIVRASTAQQILTLGEQLAPDTTLLIEPGVYTFDRPLVLRAKQNISIRSASGDPTSVTLQGKGWEAGDNRDDIIHVANCTNVTIAALTLAEARSYGVKVEAENAPHDIHIFNCRFRNIGVRAIKGSAGNDPNIRAVGGSVRFCDFENDKVPPATWLYNGDYIGGIDMMRLKYWIFSDNTFRNIKGRNGGGRAAIFIWVRSENIVIKRNVIVNCDRGISIGNPGVSTAADAMPYAIGVTILNNMISGGADCGIENWHTLEVHTDHNSIWRPDRNFNRGLRVGDGALNTISQNNLIHGGIQLETGADFAGFHNITNRLNGYFADPENGDLSLTADAAEAINHADANNGDPYDIRGRFRTIQPDVGAWEFDAPPTNYWVEPMRQVHSKFKGHRGTLAHFGDSITFSSAYWTPLTSKPRNMSTPVEKAYDLMRKYMRADSFQQKGPEFGNTGSTTMAWARDNIAKWLTSLNPEAAVIMFGSNDAASVLPADYEQALRQVVDACLDNGTIPILTTPPPRRKLPGDRYILSGAYDTTIRRLALEKGLPLIDYSYAIDERRPFDYDGSRGFQDTPGDTYEVHTLISRDGVHPSNTRAYINDFSDRALSNNGFTLRNYLTLLTYAEVIQQVLK